MPQKIFVVEYDGYEEVSAMQFVQFVSETSVNSQVC
jgi:hypothetical protein